MHGCGLPLPPFSPLAKALACRPPYHHHHTPPHSPPHTLPSPHPIPPTPAALPPHERCRPLHSRSSQLIALSLSFLASGGAALSWRQARVVCVCHFVSEERAGRALVCLSRRSRAPSPSRRSGRIIVVGSGRSVLSERSVAVRFGRGNYKSDIAFVLWTSGPSFWHRFCARRSLGSIGKSLSVR